MQTWRIFFVVVWVFIIVGCKESTAPLPPPLQTIISSPKFEEFLMKSIRYVADSRTEFCFAYLWGGGKNGGPALTEVPCKEIPKDLIQRGLFEEFLMKSIRYVADSRTEFCYAYLWEGGETGGNALAKVSCEKIPKGLLTKLK